MGRRTFYKTIAIESPVYARFSKLQVHCSAKAGRRLTVTEVFALALDAIEERASKGAAPWEPVARDALTTVSNTVN